MSVKTAKAVYRGYMPIDLPQHRPKNTIKPWFRVVGRPRVTIYPKQDENVGYSETPEYPPLNDGTPGGVKTQFRLDWYDTIRRLPTVDEKLYEIGKHRNQYIAHFNNWLPGYNSLPMIQYLTQTHLVGTLPQKYSKTSEADQKLIPSLKQMLLDQVALDKYESIKKSPSYVSIVVRDGNRKAHVSNTLVQNLVSMAKKSLALEVNRDLLNYKYDTSPAIRSWWFHSGFEPPNNKVFYKSRKDADGHINQMIQADGGASLAIRDDKFFEPQIAQTDPCVTDTSLVQKFSHPLRDYGAVFKHKNPVALPGFWFEDEPKVDCPHTCFLNTDCLNMREKKIHLNPVKPTDIENCLQGQSIMTAYGWMNSLSMSHGYTPFQEIDYPFTCQIITTDGQNWMFDVYQMNSHTFHRDLGGPKMNNIYWSSGVKQLYKEYKDGSFHEVNDEVVQLLIRFLAQKTSAEYTSQLNLRPHLGADTRSDEEKAAARAEFKKNFENRGSRWPATKWKVPLYEHLFFRAKENRNRITFMKPPWHIPKPPQPKMFD